MLLYDNAFSPFARKVRLVLEHKGLAHEVVDGLTTTSRARLEKVNGRVEVPALDHDGVVVVGSSDIVAYLERIAPERSVYPREASRWVQARAWERCADTLVDPIIVNLSYWLWAERPDARPETWVAAARRDLDLVYVAVEQDLEGQDFVCGELSIADVALFPHITATKTLGVPYDAGRFPRLHAWMKRLREMPIFEADLARSKAYISRMLGGDANMIERRRIFWRGDRIEWLLANGFHDWLVGEIKEDRVAWPGPGIPGPRVGERRAGK
jgi:glutathione S-transferase